MTIWDYLIETTTTNPNDKTNKETKIIKWNKVKEYKKTSYSFHSPIYKKYSTNKKVKDKQVIGHKKAAMNQLLNKKFVNINIIN